MVRRRSLASSVLLLLSWSSFAPAKAGPPRPDSQLSDAQTSLLVQLRHELQAAGPLDQSADLSPRIHRAFLLGRLAWLTLFIGELDTARQYADAALLLESSFRRLGGSPDLVHWAHLVLGHVALAGGDVEVAKAHLLAAGQPSGAGALSSFGPNMTLAKALLREGELTTVLQYLELCAEFWPETHTLATWQEAVRKGAMPDFGKNLVYGIP